MDSQKGYAEGRNAANNVGMAHVQRNMHKNLKMHILRWATRITRKIMHRIHTTKKNKGINDHTRYMTL